MNDFFVYTDKMTVGYNGSALIENIEIKVSRGEILTLIGPNGSGKSTILKSLIQQLRLIAGTVYLDGRAMREMSEKDVAKRLSVLMTERIHPELMTCYDVVATGRYPYTGRLGILSNGDREKVQKAMDMVSASELADCDFSCISDGQRQRVLLARAICQEPDIIVLDEPTSFLDIRHKLELLSILKKMVREKNLAVIMSLHELDLAQKVSDSVVCVNGNSIERCGKPEDIFTDDYIRHLYGITSGSYNTAFGCMEMEPVSGKPKVFVIGGNGSGIPVYRRLQRQGTGFAAGVLHENDLDYPVAKALASELITEKAFEPISKETLERAKKLMLSCEKVVCRLTEFGTMNRGNQVLLEEAQKAGILETSEE